MAENQPAKKRRVKNPETFRERAQKATEGGDQPKRAQRIKSAGGQATGPVRRQFGRLYNSKPMTPVRKVFGVLGKVLVPKYFRQSWQELKLVTWPDWKTSRRLTFAVLVFAVVFGAAIAGVDWALDKAFKALLLN